MADLLKAQGNKAFAAKDWSTAIDLFTQAIHLDPKNHVLYSNRSAAHAGKKQWDDALKDADACIQINPNWGKGYVRKGAALHGAHKWDEAIAAYEEGIKVEDSPALQKGLQEVKTARDSEDADPAGMGKMFQDPSLFAKLAANPKTAPLLADPSFMQKIRMIQQNPALAGSAFNDPRMISVLGVLMGIDMQGFSGEDVPPEYASKAANSTSNASASASSSTAHATASASASTSASKPSPRAPTPPPAEDVKMDEPEEQDEDAIAEKKAKEEALEEKAKGNDAYKKRQFDIAISAFEKAWDLWPKDVTFLTNLSAAYYENEDYDKSIATCEKAVDEARSLRADFKLIAKAYGRIGSCYLKKSDYTNAIKFFNKSLTEHRTPDVLNKLRDAERQKKETEVQEYVNPELAEKAREDGNAKFKAGQFADAVQFYTEAIKRDPKDPRSYNNRALAYTKLVALPEALRDAKEATKVDPTFVKGYIRESIVLQAMREYSKSIEAIQAADAADTERKHSAEIEQQRQKVSTAMYNQRAGESEEETLQRAMRDPEVAQIMQDPVINQILQQAQQNPAALQDHMKNPVVNAKIQKLMAAGIIRMR